ncbi:MAG: tRNA guanosine(34) transglycosylase Tgt [Sedimentisphaerales bacterium]|nr:tRNA guanosine(34) transglycosylase Tgt [Planctomycetota bacterium]MDY0356458.1 tRNA guanosine(34) transglycosylase Tgt [Sedimentisphaerales bacterium]NLT77977.1 tRNA guanosine(34) transglycosylase Tgt [Planctomycetota bacterium]
MPHFEVIASDPHCGARRGVLTTAHGAVQTPAFMPVGTAGTVKGLTPDQIEATGAAIILGNTYHLMLRPGVEVVERIGGLHRFTAWDRPILTDSGGYQVFSLSALTRIDDEGVEFASHVDGAKVHLNAEIATDIQNRLGADVIMCFDECTPFPAEPDRLEKAVARTVAWARRCRQAHRRDGQLLFGIVQGGIDLALRSHCAEEIVRIGFDGYAIGGLSVGEGHEHMVHTVEHTAALLPADRPRYLMGVGMPADIIAAVRAGVDMFDCVLPTRNGRNAFAFTRQGSRRLRNSAHIDSIEPIEAGCDCYACRHFTRGAIRHFFNCSEMLGPILLSLHNLRFYQRLLAEIRLQIERGTFDRWAAAELTRGDTVR